MQSPGEAAPLERSLPWVVIAHVIGALLVAGIEAASLGSGSLALATLPIFAAVGLVAGALVAGAEGLARRSLEARPLLTALVIAAPSVIVTYPACATLFDGAFARTLPLAPALPYLVPLVVWLGLAAAVALGRFALRGADRTGTAIAILVLAGLFGALVKGKQMFIGPQYPSAQAGVSLASIVTLGVLVRVVHRARVHVELALIVAVIVVGTATAALLLGLRDDHDRQLLGTRSSATRDVVRIARDLVDRDGDGSSPVLGGGDCDDGDPARYPGARDLPADGIDQDCDGADALPPERIDEPPPAGDPDWRADPEVSAMLAAAKTRDIVLLTVDALRYDVLAPTAQHREDFPNLVKLLDESAWFTRAIAPASGTDISLSTLLSGRADPFQPIATTLIEALRASGRRTYVAIPEEVTRYVGDVMIRRGVDKLTKVHTDWDVQDVGDHVSAPVTTLEGIRALDDAKGRPAFYWLHYFDVHEHHQIKLGKAQLDAVHAVGPPKAHAYRALLAQIDREVGRYFEERTKRGLAEPIVVFASDHGESLGEDTRLGQTHGRVTYASLVRVPLAIRVPGVPRFTGQRTDAASLLDLAPTLLSLVGTPGAMAPTDGRDLVPAIVDAKLAARTKPRALVVHEEWQWSVVEWPHQLIVNPAENLVELYDLEADPTQQRDLSHEHPDVVAHLKMRYSSAPDVHVDRTPAGRQWREHQAQPGAKGRAPPPRSAVP